jgi:PIN domain nuclease of toxin-antitoxin system
MVVLDTSTLLFWTLDPDLLSGNARQAIDETDQLMISSISVWEIGLKAKRGRLKIPMSISDYAERLQQLEKLEILPVDIETWLTNLDLDWEHHDPADRTIVATAIRLACPLITSDRAIQSFYQGSIW